MLTLKVIKAIIIRGSVFLLLVTSCYSDSDPSVKVSVLNFEEERLDAKCLKAEISKFQKMVKEKALTGLMLKVLVFEVHPLVSEVIEGPHLKLDYSNRSYLVPLNGEEYYHIIGISLVNGVPDYAAYASPKKEIFNAGACVIKE